MVMYITSSDEQTPVPPVSPVPQTTYEPTPRQMATVSQAHVIFVNGWDLEEKTKDKKTYYVNFA